VVSVGIDGEGPTGPGRDGPNKTTRNSMTLWNVGWRASLFWDGRSSSLEEQALLPIENEIEMGRDIDSLIADLREIDGYQLLFAAAFPTDFEPITAANLARALAALQRTFVSDWAPYDRYMAGDIGALKPDVVQGMHLFAEAGCESCHTPPLFESERYVARGIDGDDEGRFEQTADPADRGAFRIPTLRNLRETGPYFHDGSVTTLEEAVAHEAAISAARNEGLALNSDEVEKVARFINKALMDRSREPYRPKEVPSGLEVPKDGFRIPR